LKNYTWHRIAGSANEIPFNTNNLAVIEVHAKMICLGRQGDSVFAVAYKCPHAGALLSEGWIDARGNIVCPLHGYRFNMENGRNVTGEGYRLKHWPIDNREDGIYIGFEQGLFNSP
jgi:3-phenylpropionate/trans-cinnamate dioxygenase ferredoxin subunit